ncbi:hypothetical protein D9756_009291 [Leucocoprinus leucothites]|uniref:Uncharacterized protein n=1 Tax=Leucocoprinus leucothites TaxID=201217 RepID=A0A8H5CZN2_9AGAR|nr:hypothetical protein D9756_009291 [Leucoagaricus leucothites]
MGFAKFRIGRPGAHHARHSRRATTPNASCKTGGFYQAPTNQQSVDSLQPLEIKWDNTCLDTQKADIYLYAPSATRSRVAIWQNVDFTNGSATVNLMPRWWNSTASINLQLGIVPAGQAPFQSIDMPAGPIFTATYTKPADGQTPPAADTSITASPVIDMNQQAQSQKSHGMTPGKTAAAVLIPLLLVIAGVVAYIRWQRKKAEQKTKRFSVKIDQRMSTISTDWRSVTAAGANAAIRNSMAVNGNRSSSFSFGAIRPASTFNPDENQAGVGTGATGTQMSQMRTGVGLRNPSNSVSYTGERVSRVSFADTVNRQSRVSFADGSRPSTDSGARRGARPYHEGYVPPVPSLPPNAATAGASSSHDNDDASTSSPSTEEGVTLSPRQTQGALTLTPEDIRARILAGSQARARSTSNASAPPTPPKEKEDNYDDVLPALSMMRTDQSEEFLLPSPPPQSHAPLHTASYPESYTVSLPPTSYPYATATPITSPGSPPPAMMSPVMATMPMPASVMSPDEMLRAYAERKKSNTTPVSVVGHGYNMTMAPAIASPPMAAMGLPMSMPMSPPPTGVMSPQSTGSGNVRSLTGYGHTKKQSVGVGQYGGARYSIGDDEDPYGGTA